LGNVLIGSSTSPSSVRLIPVVEGREDEEGEKRVTTGARLIPGEEQEAKQGEQSAAAGARLIPVG
jgi:hypothetical protein